MPLEYLTSDWTSDKRGGKESATRRQTSTQVQWVVNTNRHAPFSFRSLTSLLEREVKNDSWQLSDLKHIKKKKGNIGINKVCFLCPFGLFAWELMLFIEMNMISSARVWLRPIKTRFLSSLIHLHSSSFELISNSKTKKTQQNKTKQKCWS